MVTLMDVNVQHQCNANRWCQFDVNSWYKNNFHFWPIVDGQLISSIDIIMISIQNVLPTGSFVYSTTHYNLNHWNAQWHFKLSIGALFQTHMQINTRGYYTMSVYLLWTPRTGLVLTISKPGYISLQISFTVKRLANICTHEF